jgi:hypothetical protein
MNAPGLGEVFLCKALPREDCRWKDCSDLGATVGLIWPQHLGLRHL